MKMCLLALCGIQPASLNAWCGFSLLPWTVPVFSVVVNRAGNSDSNLDMTHFKVIMLEVDLFLKMARVGFRAVA